MDVDALMDNANRSVEAIFGRTVTYVPASTSVAVEDPEGKLCADFHEHYELRQDVGTARAGDTVPALDWRSSLLEEFGVLPTRGDRVTFDVRGAPRTYRVQAALISAAGSTLTLLGEQT